MAAQADLAKLRANLGGVKNMQRPPDAMFVIDLKVEEIAVKEARRLRIPIIGLVDTNCDPDGIDYVIPGNDDAIRSCVAVTKAIGDIVSQGRGAFQAAEQARQQAEAEARARKDAEDRARKEAEEAAKQAAEAQAKQAAEAAAAPAEGAAPAATEPQAPVATPTPEPAPQKPAAQEAPKNG